LADAKRRVKELKNQINWVMLINWVSCETRWGICVFARGLSQWQTQLIKDHLNQNQF